MADGKVYLADYAKRVANCKRCKSKLEKGTLRLAKLTANPFGGDDDNMMKSYFHPSCIFDSFLRAKAMTKIIEEEEDIDGFCQLKDEDKEMITKLIKDILEKRKQSPSKKKKMVQAELDLRKNGGGSPIKRPEKKMSPERSITPPLPLNPNEPVGKSDNFREFRKLCADIADESGYLAKTEVVRKFIDKDKFDGNLYLIFKLLLPGVVKRIYNLNNKQLVKLFSQIFRTDLNDMIENLEKGDVADTIKVFFEKSKTLKPIKKSKLTNQEVDNLLENLSTRTKEDEQQHCLKNIASKCTYNDLKMVVRLIKHDLRINAGSKHILDALDPNAYEAFKASHNLKDVINRVQKRRSGELVKELSIKACLMTPVKPMLAEACKSVESAITKCPNGMYAEIKYDGERVQLHKKGDKFCYFSRSLKPVQAHKVSHFKDYIPKAFPGISDLILDCEVLLIDTKTSKPLPFGTLGVHKKAAFKDANVCLFIFDCLLYKDENLMDKPLKERRAILEDNMTEIPNRILFSEKHKINKPQDLQSLLTRVFNEKLEGLVLKDIKSIYEPGKRHWLKVKKDYLASGAMADTADLVVLGAYFGTGNKGGLMSIFLMGVYDPKEKVWLTVTKCGSGFDDQTLEILQKKLEVVKISQDKTKVPSWLRVSSGYVPDFVVKDPKKAPVWEVTGTEFSKSEAHTAEGISIRFPRCTKMRDDKSWEEATDLERLKVLFEESKNATDIAIPCSSAEGFHSNNENSEDEKESLLKPTKKLSKKRTSESQNDSSPKRPKIHTSASPVKTEEKIVIKKSKEFGPKNKLPDYFTDVKFFVEGSMKNFKEIRRHIIAFGGNITNDRETDNPDYIISDKQSDNKKYRTENWFRKCVKKGRVVE